MSIINTTEYCRHCLMCRHMCPVGHVTFLETYTPHGWGQMVASEKRGLFAWSKQSASTMFACADCGMCEAHCVTDQPLPAALAAARGVLVERGLAPDRLQALVDRLSTYGNAFVDVAPEPAQGTGTAALFVGDEAAHLRPETLEAALALLRRVGVDPVLIGRGRNDGFTPASLGYEGIAKQLAETTLAELSATGATRLYVLSPGAAFAIGEVYAKRLGLTLPAGVEIVDVATFLAQKLGEGAISFNRAAVGIPIAYVDPTHTIRVLGRIDAPRALLRAVLPDAPVELFWRGDRAFPAGNLPFAFAEPEIADKLTKSRLEDARSRGAQGLVTECPGTLAALSEHAGAYGLHVQGLFELLAER
ncbi:MAG: (Fe-S)-binding protein [Rhodothermales bacterium]|nr:(Fe-S)-binding protein [Rhodothermales bacterium]